jgi:hypothetical protein
MLRRMRDGFVGTDGISPHAVDIESPGSRGIARAANRDSEADVRAPDVCNQTQHRVAVELLSITRAGQRCIDCHHLAPKKAAKAAPSKTTLSKDWRVNSTCLLT